MNTEQLLAQSIGVPIEIKQVPINGYRINYVKAGNGPAIVLVHGANFGWGVWYPNIPELAKHFTVYAIDLPGSGRSTRVDYRKLDLYKDLLDVVDGFTQVHHLKRFHMIGCSAGGWVAVKMALRHPKKVDKLVLENTAGFSGEPKMSEKVIGLYPFARLISKTSLNPNRKDKKNIEKFLMSIFYDGKHIRREFIDYFLETMETSHNLLFISRMTALWRDFILDEDIPRIGNKTLVVWGKEDKLMPFERNIVNVSSIIGVKVEAIHGAGHIPSLEKADVFNSMVIDFLR